MRAVEGEALILRRRQSKPARVQIDEAHRLGRDYRPRTVSARDVIRLHRVGLPARRAVDGHGVHHLIVRSPVGRDGKGADGALGTACGEGGIEYVSSIAGTAGAPKCVTCDESTAGSSVVTRRGRSGAITGAITPRPFAARRRSSTGCSARPAGRGGGSSLHDPLGTGGFCRDSSGAAGNFADCPRVSFQRAHAVCTAMSTPSAFAYGVAEKSITTTSAGWSPCRRVANMSGWVAYEPPSASTAAPIFVTCDRREQRRARR